MTNTNHHYEVTFVRNPIDPKSKIFEEACFRWHVKINNQSFDFYTGRGCVIEKTNKPKKPTLDDVLFCLITDSSANNLSFTDWCDEFDYDFDSRQALDIYLKCQENTKKLIKAGIDIEAERERLEDF